MFYIEIVEKYVMRISIRIFGIIIAVIAGVVLCEIVTCIVYSDRGGDDDSKAGYKIYPGMRFLKSGWRGMGDSLVDYPQDSILYYGLGIDGKSLEEVVAKYGEYATLEYDTLRYGIGLDGWPEIYPISQNRVIMPIIEVWWSIPGDSTTDIQLTVFFETKGIKSKAVYGYQFDYAQTCWMP